MVKVAQKKFLIPGKLAEQFELKEGMSVADFGSGAGHWAKILAREVGINGIVYAIDIRHTVLEVLSGHKNLTGVQHVQSIRADLEKPDGSTLQDKSQDLVLCSNLLHQVDDVGAVIKEAHRILKKGGKLAIVEWAELAPWGPKKRVKKLDIEKLAQEAGFSSEKELEAGHSHYGLLFIK